jgi:hypothetical protein
MTTQTEQPFIPESLSIDSLSGRSLSDRTGLVHSSEPLTPRIVSDLNGIERYAYSGHGRLIGKIEDK